MVYLLDIKNRLAAKTKSTSIASNQQSAISNQQSAISNQQSATDFALFPLAHCKLLAYAL